MRIKDIRGESFDFSQAVGIAITLENGMRHAISLRLPMDTEELPEVFQKAGKMLRDWAREQSDKEES